MSAERILVVDDDRALLRVLSIGLAARGYEVLTARTGLDGVVQASLHQPDVVVLDMSLPDIDGVEVCGRIREFSDVPIVVLSALGSESARSRRSIAVRTTTSPSPSGWPSSRRGCGCSCVGRAPPAGRAGRGRRRTARVRPRPPHGHARRRPLRLTAKEFDLLAYLARHAGKVCTHQMILREVWGATYSTEANYLRVYAHRVRKKLGAHGAMLVTHAGIGYELADGRRRRRARRRG